MPPIRTRKLTHSIAAAPHMFAKRALHASTMVVDARNARRAKTRGTATMECVSERIVGQLSA
eukprot:3270930-Lingulodinium_polyedra.AAC.1